MDNGKGELANKDENAAKKQKVVTLDWNVNRVIEEIANCGITDTSAI